MFVKGQILGALQEVSSPSVKEHMAVGTVVFVKGHIAVTIVFVKAVGIVVFVRGEY